MSSRMRRVVAVLCAFACAPDPKGLVTEPTSTDVAWCEVQAVLEDKCQRCHGDPREHGAPFSLLSYEDTQLNDSRGKPRFERIRSAIDSGYMPATWLDLEPPVETLTDDERAVILDWIEAGAEPEGGTDCR